MLAAARIADRTGEIAGVADLDERKAAVLLMIGTEAAVIGTAVLDWCVINHRLLRSLDEDFAGAAVIVNVIGHKNALMAMLRAALQHPDLAVFEDDLGIDAAIAGGADGDGDVVEEIGSELIGHLCSFGRTGAWLR